MRILASLLLGLSLNAFAGYQCELSLVDSENLNKVLASKKVSASEKDLRSEMIEDFFVEPDKTSFMVKVFIDGWVGEEEMSATVYGRKRPTDKFEPLSEKVSLRGDDNGSLWFDSYKLKVTCSLA